LEVVKVLQANKKAMVIDDISWKSKVRLGKMSSILLNLEFKGLVNAFPGKKFSLSV